MNALVFALPGNEAMAQAIARHLNAGVGVLDLHQFPDGEHRVRIGTPVRDQTAMLVCSLHHPDARALPLYLVASALRDQHAAQVLLIAPYLAYMRQDTVFQQGEGVSARHFARWLSSFLDALVTVDPHLHRIRALPEIYRIPSEAVTASPAISRWIRDHVQDPLLIGPDEESKQWVADVARAAGAPFVVLEKARRGDRDVRVAAPSLEQWSGHTPVLVDDIISTARTMIETTRHLHSAGMRAPVCIGVHAVFAAGAHAELVAAGAARIVTCNTIPHETNEIDVAPLIAEATKNFYAPGRYPPLAGKALSEETAI